MHQARWMARAIYSMKICLLQSQFKMSVKDKQTLQEVCLFIVAVYVKPWLGYSLVVKAPNQDLSFLKTLKDYETVDKLISEAALSKFSQHLWYLTEEIVVLSIFDDEVDEQTKRNIVANLQRESFCNFEKRYVPSKEEMSVSIYEKSLSDFVSQKSKDLFSRLKIDSSFLQENVSSWEENAAFVEAKKKVFSLKAVNDTAERAVKLMQDFHGLITADEEQKQFLLRCVQEHRKMYPDCKKETLKRKYPK